MKLRIAVLLAWAVAMPAFAQAPAVPAPARPTPPTRPLVSGVRPAPAAPSLIDVNSADEKTLDKLPGVGAARVKLIIENRPYTEKQQLVDRKALPASVLASVEDKIALVDVNKTSAADMAKILPNVGPVRAQQIVDRRPYATLQDVVTKGALSPGIFAGLRGLITAGS
jgi:DNA uptake protein ComE-like DNA-binding protein